MVFVNEVSYQGGEDFEDLLEAEAERQAEQAFWDELENDVDAEDDLAGDLYLAMLEERDENMDDSLEDFAY